MSTHRIGRRYERLAARSLEADGWRILARNFRAGRAEIDLIVRRDRLVAFVEVKGRREVATGHPFEAVTRRKRMRIEAAARAWIREHGRPGDAYRLDVLAVHDDHPGRPPRIEHLPDAWRPDGRG